MSRRRQVREVCVQVLYQLDLNPDVAWTHIDQYIRERLHGDRQRIDTAIERIQGIQRHQHEIDRRISSIATHWKLSRISPVDRAILRLGVFELLYEGTPGPVAINEAIELAKRFGDDQSPRFVNGILDSLYKSTRISNAAGAESDSPESRETPASDADDADEPPARACLQNTCVDHLNQPVPTTDPQPADTSRTEPQSGQGNDSADQGPGESQPTNDERSDLADRLGQN